MIRFNDATIQPLNVLYNGVNLQFYPVVKQRTSRTAQRLTRLTFRLVKASVGLDVSQILPVIHVHES